MSHKYNQEIASAKSGMSSKTARKYLSSNNLPNEIQQNRYWKTPEVLTKIYQRSKGYS